MTEQMVQCRLQRKVAHGVTETTTGWIEARGAKVSASVELHKGSGEFWTVLHVGTVMTKDMLKEHQSMHRRSLVSIEPMAPAKTVGTL